MTMILSRRAREIKSLLGSACGGHSGKHWPSGSEPPTRTLPGARPLGAMGTEARYAVLPLGETLNDGDPLVREAAAKALQRLGREARDAVPALTATLKDKNKSVRIAVAYALAEIGPDAQTAVP